MAFVHAISTGSHPSSPGQSRDSQSMGCRAGTTHSLTCIGVHRKYQGVPRVAKRYTGLPPSNHDRGLSYRRLLHVLTIRRYQHRPIFVLSGVRSGLHVKGGESAYAQYVKYLEKTSPAVQAERTEGTVEHFAQGYQDYLQNPLQVGLFLLHI